MDNDLIKSDILKLLIKLSKIKSIKFDTLFANNEKIDSLDLLNLYSLLEKKYKVKFKSSELAKLSSIENIFKVINKKKKDNKIEIEFKKKIAAIFETNIKKIEFHKKISEFENFDSLKILEIISFFSNAKKEINPNKINDKTKFIDLYNFYNK